MATRNQISPDRPNDVQKLKFARSVSWAGLYVLLLASAIAASGQLGSSRGVTPGLIAHYVGLFGASARGRLEDWKEHVREIGKRRGPARNPSGEVELLDPVNQFFNGLSYTTDLALWRVEDYWATPAEFQSIGGGDCEDFALAKYFALKELGIPAARLRLVYAKTWRSAVGHIVLAYYPSPGADPLILDILSGSIELASQRRDLTPVFSFNDEDLLLPGMAAQRFELTGSSGRQWLILVEKLKRELAY